MRSARPLGRFPLFRSRNAEEMSAALAEVYTESTVCLESGARTADVVMNYRQLDDTGIGYTRCGIGMDIAYSCSDRTLQRFPIRGEGEATIDGIVTPIRPYRGMIVSANAKLATRVDAEYEHFILVMNTRTLTRKLAAIVGAPIDRPLLFHPAPGDDAGPAARTLLDHFLFLVDKLSTSAVALPKLLLTEFEQTLMAMVLGANRHNYSHLLEQAPPDAASAQVRRAEEYIEANWHRPMTLESLAAVAGVSAFALFRSFKRSRGCSPMQFANQVRLRHARELLRRADAATSVAAVAASCGFIDLHRFAADYVRVFGEQPAQTLRRADA